MLFSKFSWNWHSGSGKENFQNCQYIYAILISSPLGKRRSLLFKQIWIPVTQGCVVISLVEICSVVLEKMKMWNKWKGGRRLTTGDYKSSLETNKTQKIYDPGTCRKIISRTQQVYNYYMTTSCLSDYWSVGYLSHVPMIRMQY